MDKGSVVNVRQSFSAESNWYLYAYDVLLHMKLFVFLYQLYNIQTIISELLSKETTLWWSKVDFTKHTEFNYQFLPLEDLFKVWSLNLDPDSEYSWLSNSLARWVEAGKWL